MTEVNVLMKISTKGRYALRMLLDLAEHQDGNFVSLKEIAARQGISKKYLEQIVPVLNKSEILYTTRGFQGGYQLAKKPEEYTVGQILRLTEGSLSPTAAAEYNSVSEQGNEFVILSVCKGLDQVIDQYLDSITLQDLLERQREQYANDYII